MPECGTFVLFLRRKIRHCPRIKTRETKSCVSPEVRKAAHQPLPFYGLVSSLCTFLLAQKGTQKRPPRLKTAQSRVGSLIRLLYYCSARLQCLDDVHINLTPECKVCSLGLFSSSAIVLSRMHMPELPEVWAARAALFEAPAVLQLERSAGRYGVFGP